MLVQLMFLVKVNWIEGQLLQKMQQLPDRSVIGRHINNVYKEKELTRDITCANFAHIGTDADQTCYTTLYNLDVIISVGYRVKSQRGMQFRIWANRVLKDYFVKGYAVNERIHKEQIGELRTDR